MAVKAGLLSHNGGSTDSTQPAMREMHWLYILGNLSTPVAPGLYLVAFCTYSIQAYHGSRSISVVVFHKHLSSRLDYLLRTAVSALVVRTCESGNGREEGVDEEA
jgi:hypothetical protein